jgi:tellurite resistance protein TehA-like permease
MATGILSNGFFLLGHRVLSDALLVVGFAAFPLLLAALVLRALLYPRRLWADLVDPRLVFTFFTLVAATDVLGSGLHLRGNDTPATGLWLFALAVWIVLGHLSVAVLTFVNSEEGAEVVHGGWPIAIVGTESLVILGARGGSRLLVILGVWPRRPSLPAHVRARLLEPGVPARDVHGRDVPAVARSRLHGAADGRA